MLFNSKFFTNIIQNGLKMLNDGSANNFVRCVHTLTRSSLDYSNILCKNSLVESERSLLSPMTSLFNQMAGFKVRARLKRRCKDCLVVVRHQRCYIICPTHGRHKQMSMKKREYKSWILTHAMQSKVRPY